MRSLVIVAVLLILTVCTVAPTASAQSSGSSGTLLEWPEVTLLIYPREVTGMHLDVQAPTRLTGLRQPHGYRAFFDPERVFTWLNQAQLVVRPAQPPTGPEAVLVTPVLKSYDGDSLRLIRRAEGAEWSSRIAVLLDSRDDHFDLLMRASEIPGLLRAMQKEAGLSTYDGETVAEMPARARGERQDSVTTPQFVRIPVSDGQSGPFGSAVLEFVVGVNGKVDLASVTTIASTSAMFTQWARRMVIESTYLPGRTAAGEPVAVLVRQTVRHAP